MTAKGQIPLERPDRTFSDKVRSGSLGSPTSPWTLSGCRPAQSIQTCMDFVRGSGQVAYKVCRSVQWNLETTRHDQCYCSYIYSLPYWLLLILHRLCIIKFNLKCFNVKLCIFKNHFTKIIANRCQILTLNAPKLISAGALPQTSLGSLQCSPDYLAEIKGTFF